jgi:hypothetical protein
MVMVKTIAAAAVAILIGTAAAEAAAACPAGYMTCAQWCKTYRIDTPANQQYCLVRAAKSCKNLWGSLSFCVRNRPPANWPL